MEGHIPEKDGVVANLMIAELIAASGRTPKETLGEIAAQVGTFFSQRVDIHLTPETKEALMTSLGERPIESVDGQPVTDQQSKIFSNQIPLDSIQSLEVISGAPPAEFGEKTSVVINVTTRSGLGESTPHGALTTSYGSFGTSNVGFNLAYGGPKWGNFISISGLNSGRFLDPPEFTVIHAKGNEQTYLIGWIFNSLKPTPST